MVSLVSLVDWISMVVDLVVVVGLAALILIGVPSSLAPTECLTVLGAPLEVV